MPGAVTSVVEQEARSTRHGIWLLLDGQEYFLPYEQFPWFKGQPDDVLNDFEEIGQAHLFWPQLDVDLTLDMIRHPERYPLVAH